MIPLELYLNQYRQELKLREEDLAKHIDLRAREDCRGLLDRLLNLKGHDYDKSIEIIKKEIKELKNRPMLVTLRYYCEGKTDFYLDEYELKETKTESREYGVQIPMKAEAVNYMIAPKYQGKEPSFIGVEYDSTAKEKGEYRG